MQHGVNHLSRFTVSTQPYFYHSRITTHQVQITSQPTYRILVSHLLPISSRKQLSIMFRNSLSPSLSWKPWSWGYHHHSNHQQTVGQLRQSSIDHPYQYHFQVHIHSRFKSYTISNQTAFRPARNTEVKQWDHRCIISPWRVAFRQMCTFSWSISESLWHYWST